MKSAFWLLLASCLALGCVDMLDGLPCDSSADCLGYACTNARCRAPAGTGGLSPSDGNGGSGLPDGGSGGDVVLASGQQYAEGAVVSEDHVYWSRIPSGHSAGHLTRVQKTGGIPQVLAVGAGKTGNQTEVPLAILEDAVLFARPSGDAAGIWARVFSGGETHLTAVREVYAGVGVYGDHLFFVGTPHGCYAEECSSEFLFRASRSGGAATVVAPLGRFSTRSQTSKMFVQHGSVMAWHKQSGGLWVFDAESEVLGVHPDHCPSPDGMAISHEAVYIVDGRRVCAFDYHEQRWSSFDVPLSGTPYGIAVADRSVFVALGGIFEVFPDGRPARRLSNRVVSSIAVDEGFVYYTTWSGGTVGRVPR